MFLGHGSKQDRVYPSSHGVYILLEESAPACQPINKTISDDKCNEENKTEQVTASVKTHTWAQEWGPFVLLCWAPFGLMASKAVRCTAGELSSVSDIFLSSNWNPSPQNSTHLLWFSPQGLWEPVSFIFHRQPITRLCPAMVRSWDLLTPSLNTPESLSHFPVSLPVWPGLQLINIPLKVSHLGLKSLYIWSRQNKVISPFLILCFFALEFVFTFLFQFHSTVASSLPHSQLHFPNCFTCRRWHISPPSILL